MGICWEECCNAACDSGYDSGCCAWGLEQEFFSDVLLSKPVVKGGDDLNGACKTTGKNDDGDSCEGTPCDCAKALECAKSCNNNYPEGDQICWESCCDDACDSGYDSGCCAWGIEQEFARDIMVPKSEMVVPLVEMELHGACKTSGKTE